MRSPLKAPEQQKQQAARQDKNCNERRRKIKAWEIIDIPSWIEVGLRRAIAREPVPWRPRSLGSEIWKQ